MLNSEYLYGLPQRTESFRLKPTMDSGPYRLFNQDLFPHHPSNMIHLYGSVPYMMGHSIDHDVGIAWMNSADTWVDIHQNHHLNDIKYNNHRYGQMDGSYTSFASEGGKLQFFVFATS
mmetsp:Transcript_42692/g.30793  ORF Transcript_42692/g.30793 Transcript_42692/m.30793 type:complete len:118 (+) Transcript_42692:337-690(+)